MCVFGAGRAEAADDARQIMEQAQKRTDTRSQRYEGRLQTTDRSGKTSEKRWTFQRLGAHGASKLVIRFTAPAEVKGVALLVENHTDRASDQWMWTPAIERDRRIASQDRSTRFFGTDFSFEDLEERDTDQFEFTLDGDEMIDGVLCWRIQSVPKRTKTSQYSKSVVWIRKDNYATARIDSYVKDSVARRLENRDIRRIQGIWTAHDMTIADLRRGSHTRLLLDRVQYDVDVAPRDFTLQALRK
jgi:hypothetical protein